MALLRKYFLPHLEKLCKNFLDTIIHHNARTVKMTTLNIFDEESDKRNSAVNATEVLAIQKINTAPEKTPIKKERMLHISQIYTEIKCLNQISTRNAGFGDIKAMPSSSHRSRSLTFGNVAPSEFDDLE